MGSGNRKVTHEPLPSKLWPAAQGGPAGRSYSKDPGEKQGAGGSEDAR